MMNSMRHRAVTVALTFAAAAVVAACGGGSPSGGGPSSVTPRRPVTITAGTAQPPTQIPTPAGQVATSAAEAILLAMPRITGGSTFRAENLSAVAYVETTVGQALELTGLSGRTDPGVPLDAKAWFIVAYGTFTPAGTAPGGEPPYSTSYAIVINNEPSGFAVLTDETYDLAAIGTPVIVLRGAYPQIDAVRDPAAPGDLLPPASTPAP
jgi:hypothetical protein